MQIDAVLTAAADGGVIAFDPDTGTTTQGESRDGALSNLNEAVALYREEFPASK